MYSEFQKVSMGSEVAFVMNIVSKLVKIVVSDSAFGP